MDKKKTTNPALLAAQAVGSQAALARLLNVPKQTVNTWVQARCIPRDRLPGIAKLTGLPLEVLAPDLFRR